MTRENQVRAQLHKVEQTLRDTGLWQQTAPDNAAFESTQPFCMDTLAPEAWLQWVLLPRMHALLDSHSPLPTAFAIAPYYEMALEESDPARASLLVELQALDSLFVDES